jgi:hypothetical protein
MTVDAKAEIVIERPRAEVASVMFDPKCDKLWIGGLRNVFPQTSGLLKKGAKVERVGDFLNRRFSANVLVIKDEPNKYVELSADEPFEMRVRYELNDVENGTLVKLQVQSVGENEYRQMPATIFAKAVNDAVTTDLRALKKHLENSSD